MHGFLYTQAWTQVGYIGTKSEILMGTWVTAVLYYMHAQADYIPNMLRQCCQPLPHSLSLFLSFSTVSYYISGFHRQSVLYQSTRGLHLGL